MSGQDKGQHSAFVRAAETVNQRRKDMQERVDKRKVQRDVELAHSAFIKNSVASNHELAQANREVQCWISNSAGTAKRMKEMTRRQVEEQRRIPPPFYNEGRPTAIASELLPTVVNIDDEDSEDEGKTPKNSDMTLTAYMEDRQTHRESPNEDSGEEDESLKLAIQLSLKAHKEEMTSRGVGNGIPLTGAASQSSVTDALECINLDESDNDITSTGSWECPVIDCEMDFANYANPKNELSDHMKQFQHVAFKAFMNFIPKNSYYMCPECGICYKRCRTCLGHMKSEGHTFYTAPVLVLGYGCPRCFEIFPGLEPCKAHMESLNHQECYYAFQDDTAPCADPFLYPAYVFMCMQEKVSQVHTRVHCVDCGEEVKTDTEFKKSIGQCPTGKCIASSETTLAEIFSTFLKGSTCTICLQLFEVDPNVPHECRPGKPGKVVDANCSSFAEFVRRIALAGQIIYYEGVQELTQRRKKNEQKMTLERRLFYINSSRTWFNYPPGASKDYGGPSSASDSVSCVPTMANDGAQKRKLNSERKEEDQTHSNTNSDKPKKAKSSKCKTKKSTTAIACSSQASASSSDTQQTSENDKEVSQYLAATPSILPVSDFPSVSDTLGLPKGFSLRDFSPCSQEFLKKKLEIVPKTKHNPEDPQKPSSSLFLSSGDSGVPSNGNSDRPSSSATEPKSTAPSKSDGNLTIKQDKPPAPNSTSLRVNRSAPKSEGLQQVPLVGEDPDPDYLSTMHQLVFLDLDNWSGFFKKLHAPLPDGVFIWAFIGGRTVWKEPHSCHAFSILVKNGWFHLHGRCGTTKDAADFAICLQVGRMDQALPKHIPFTVLSGDKGFCELERQLKNSKRRAVVIDPHMETPEMVHTLLKSVAYV